MVDISSSTVGTEVCIIQASNWKQLDTSPTRNGLVTTTGSLIPELYTLKLKIWFW
jgi:hypothetical protein